MAMFEPEPVAPEPGPVMRPRQPAAPRRNLASTLVLGLAALVAVGGLAFAAGRVTAPPTAAAATGLGTRNGGGFEGAGGTGGTGANGFGGAAGANGAGGFRGLGGGFGIRGTVTAVAADHLTIQLANGTTIDIPISSATTYHQQTAGAASDVQVGKQVQVQLSRPTGATASPGAASGAARLGTASDVTVLGQ